MADSEKPTFNSLRNSNSELFRGSLYATAVQQEEIELADMEMPVGTPGARKIRASIRAARLKRDNAERITKGLPCVIPNACRLRKQTKKKPVARVKKQKVLHPKNQSVEANKREAVFSAFQAKMKKNSIRKTVPANGLAWQDQISVPKITKTIIESEQSYSCSPVIRPLSSESSDQC
jgi:hypothetical protein